MVEAFRWVDVEIQPDLAPGFAGSMPFLIAMRGALGRVLSDADVTPAQESHADQPGAFRLMFHSMGEMAKGLDYPKPFVLQFEPGEDLFRVRLFGAAMSFAAEIAATLAQVAAQTVSNPFGHPVAVTARRIVVGRLSDWEGERGFSRLVFVTPLAMRHGQEMQDNPNAVLRGLLRRVSGILAWQGLGLPRPFSEYQVQLAGQFGAAHWVGRSEKPTEWQHPSSRQKRIFSETGTLGTLVLGAPANDLLPLLKLGEVLHVGSKATIGCGRIRLSL